MTRRGCSVSAYLVLCLVVVGLAASRGGPDVLVDLRSADQPNSQGRTLAPALPEAPQVSGDTTLTTGRRTSPEVGGGASLPQPVGLSGSSVAPDASVPAPTGEVGTALVGGWATWYDDGPGMYAAVPWYTGTPVTVRVCADGSRCLLLRTRDFCACGPRHGIPTVADLSREAFSYLAPLSDGIVKVTLEWPVDLPATDGS